MSLHPGFDQPNVQVVGEVGEGGDHMYVSFKNLSAQPVTIKEHTKVVQLKPRNGELSSAHEGGKKVTTEADGTSGDVHFGIHGVCVTGILVTYIVECNRNLSISSFRSVGQLGCGSARERQQGTTSYKLLDPFCGKSLPPPAPRRPQPLRRMQQQENNHLG